MGTFYSIIGIAIAIFFIWRFIVIFKARPELFTTANLNKSFFHMGILALILIAAVSFVVMLLRAA